MPPPPALCGSFLTSKRSLIALTWTVTTVLTWLAFLLALVLTIQIESHYRRMERYYQDYEGEDGQDRYLNSQDNEQQEQGSQDNASGDKAEELYTFLAHTHSGSMLFCALYTMCWALVLTFYGSTSIVGFTSLRGDYIAPCIPTNTRNASLRIGIFGGAIVMFANLLLVCAVIFGEFRVEDYRDGHEEEDVEPYAVERIATVLAVTCMFLSVLYTTFCILLFLNFNNSQQQDPLDEVKHHGTTPLVTLGDRESSHATAGFITIDSSQSGGST